MKLNFLNFYRLIGRTNKHRVSYLILSENNSYLKFDFDNYCGDLSYIREFLECALGDLKQYYRK